MTPERWAQIKELLAGALELEGPDRSAYLDRVTAADPSLRREMESLLSAADHGPELPSPLGMSSAEQAVLATALGQQYEIVRPLGHGGMGAVYLARDRALDRFVAIKILRPDLANAPEIRERFQREARVAAHLSHPGVLPLHTFGEVHGLWYFVMGYVRGASLADRLRRDGRLSPEAAQRILLELADALEVAHRAGVIHRDIKPANILLDDESGHAVLADFGIAKTRGAGEELTATGAVMGTPNFMSPEQSLGSPDVDERSDIYSLGAVGYAMLAGREPFADVRPQELTYQKLSRDAAPLQQIAAGVPPDLAAIVMRCLARNPDLRWPNARALRDALRRASGDPLALPEALRDFPTFAPYALLWGVFWIVLAFATSRPFSHIVLLLMVGAIVPIGLVLHVMNIGRHGLTKRELLRIAFWPPEWWGMWWPRRLRRPNDLWARLPWQARGVRVLLSAIFIALPTLVLVGERIALPGQSRVEPLLSAEITLVGVAAALIVVALLWAMGRGLNVSQAARLLFESTAPGPGWSAPDVATLLRPATRGPRQPEHDLPAEYRRAIADLAAEMPARADLRRSVDLADRLVAAIDECDQRIAPLVEFGGRAESERLAAQLATLGRAGSVPDSREQELHTLLRRQLELVSDMRVRAEILSQRRSRLFDLLRTLWTQLSLSAQATTPPATLDNLYHEIGVDLDLPSPSRRD